MAKAPKNAISPSRAEDYPEWYQQVIRASDLAENSPVRGLHGHQAMGLPAVGKYATCSG